jgi:hypothetical protein
MYKHNTTARLRPQPELCCGLDIFNCTEVVLTFADTIRQGRPTSSSADVSVPRLAGFSLITWFFFFFFFFF